MAKILSKSLSWVFKASALRSSAMDPLLLMMNLRKYYPSPFVGDLTEFSRYEIVRLRKSKA